MSGRTTAKLLTRRNVLVSAEMPDNVVPHPRYGTKIVPSKYELSSAEAKLLGAMKRGSFWPESALPATIAADGSGAPHIYVDRLCRCRDCFRPFVFYAREQKYWVETLGFQVDAEAVRCTDCRKSVRQVKARRTRIDETLREIKERPGPLTRDVLSDQALTALTVDLLALAETGALKKLDILKRLRRTMRDRTNGHENESFSAACKRIDKLVGPLTRKSSEV